MPLRRASPCKVNLLLNILGRRPDGYHALETLFHHVPLCDELVVDHAPDVLAEYGPGLLALFTRARPLLSPAAWADVERTLS